MRATVDSVISQLASLEAVVNNSADSTGNTTLNAEQNDILQQALKNSGLPNKNEVISKGNSLHVPHILVIRYEMNIKSNIFFATEIAEPKKTDSPTTYVTLLDKTAGSTSR